MHWIVVQMLLGFMGIDSKYLWRTLAVKPKSFELLVQLSRNVVVNTRAFVFVATMFMFMFRPPKSDIVASAGSKLSECASFKVDHVLA